MAARGEKRFCKILKNDFLKILSEATLKSTS